MSARGGVGLGLMLVRGVLIGGAVCALIALGVVWHRDRARRWAEPRLAAPEIVALVPASLEGAHELWLVALNPLCPHCRQHVARTAEAARARLGVRIGVLVVDTPKPPTADALASLGVDGLWWDARGTWRRRWGHRVYGEVMVFDGAGRYVRTLPPGFDSAP